MRRLASLLAALALGACASSPPPRPMPAGTRVTIIEMPYFELNALARKAGVYRAASWTFHGTSDEVRAYRRGDTGPLVARRAFHSGSKSLTKAQIEALGYTQLKLPGKLRFVKPLSRIAKKILAA